MDLKSRQEIGKRIEKIRVEKLNGISQVKLGQKIGTSGQNMSLIISGNGSLSLDKAIKLCEVANVSMDYIFRGIQEDNYINPDTVIKAINEFNKNNRI